MGFFQKIFSSRPSKEKGGNFRSETYRELLGFVPRRPDNFDMAFTHKSANATDRFGNPINYERLEFLGDAVLGAVIGHYLYKHVPFEDEGYLTQMRSKIVSREQLNKIGKELGVDRYFKKTFSANQMPEDVYGDTIEALVGAIYIDKGYDFCQQFIYDRIVMPYVDIENLENRVSSYKGLLIEWSQKNHKNLRFETCSTKGDDHSHEFGIKLMLDGKYLAKGRGISKKKAEEQAAKRAYYALREEIDNGEGK